MELHPITLAGKIIRLEPMTEAHVPELAQVGLDPRIWQYMIYGQMKREDDLRGWVREILSRQERGTDGPVGPRLLRRQQLGRLPGRVGVGHDDRPVHE